MTARPRFTAAQRLKVFEDHGAIVCCQAKGCDNAMYIKGCDLAGYGPATLTKRIREGAMPAPVDRAYERIFDRDAVLRALDLLPAAQQAGSASW